LPEKKGIPSDSGRGPAYQGGEELSRVDLKKGRRPPPLRNQDKTPSWGKVTGIDREERGKYEASTKKKAAFPTGVSGQRQKHGDGV